jgi:hypothetical protein
MRKATGSNANALTSSHTSCLLTSGNNVIHADPLASLTSDSINTVHRQLVDNNDPSSVVHLTHTPSPPVVNHDTHTSHPTFLSSLLSSPPTSPPTSPAVASARPTRRRRSSSSDDDYHIVSITTTMLSVTSTAVLSLNNGKRPMISAGTMTPELLHRFEHHA